MANSIEFDVESLLGQLSAVQATQIKYAGTQAMKRLGYELTQDLSQHMAKTFRNPVPYTLFSPKYDAEGLQVTLYISRVGPKGQDPARYLYPVSTEDGAGTKPAYITRFTKALWANGIVSRDRYALPWIGSRAVPTNDYGNVPNTFYQSVLAGLKRYGVPKKGGPNPGFRIFSVPDNRFSSSSPRIAHLKPGIYRAKGKQLDYLFSYATKHPSVKTNFDFSGFTFRRAEEILPTLLSQELEKALR